MRLNSVERLFSRGMPSPGHKNHGRTKDMSKLPGRLSLYDEQHLATWFESSAGGVVSVVPIVSPNLFEVNNPSSKVKDTSTEAPIEPADPGQCG